MGLSLSMSNRLPTGSTSNRCVCSPQGRARRPFGDRAVRNAAPALVRQEAEHLALLFALQQVVLVLHGNELRPAVQLGSVLHLRKLPGPHRRRA
jgi:hypothetical protein